MLLNLRFRVNLRKDGIYLSPDNILGDTATRVLKTGMSPGKPGRMGALH
jgi:hypothetical protein